MQEGEDLEEKDWYVCSVCGNTVRDEALERCRICGAPRKKFMLV